MKTKKSFTFNKLYLFAFLIPAVIMLVIFAIREIYPFGDRSFLHIDMYHQYFPFLVEFYHKLKNGESLFYSWLQLPGFVCLLSGKPYELAGHFLP